MLKTIYTCPHCGSEDLLADAYVHLNDEDDVRTFDDITCESCGAKGIDPNTERVEAGPPTNVEFVTDLMERSRRGALIQAFVLEALLSYASKVAEGKPEDFDSGMIHGAAWHDCGVELKEKLLARFA
ncbi:restriction alleviation protein, Lar family [Variovorax sp. PBS-H4]|uniref:hypothetical protein n=1 Tax=Variovorax sp. PBS-H4 TaxID=434008 RepID=UPI001318235A|nr:hypothetical protein [Variovorax sp. PBS-H4]VTU31994.1 restriction alleviation protein, Lar family [Variovorax sp. PBS-H4]